MEASALSGLHSPKAGVKFVMSLFLISMFSDCVLNIWGRKYCQKSFSNAFTLINNNNKKVLEKLQTPFLDSSLSSLQFWPHSSCESFLGEHPGLGGFASLFSSSRLVLWRVVCMLSLVSQISFLNLVPFCRSLYQTFTELNFSHQMDPSQ